MKTGKLQKMVMMGSALGWLAMGITVGLIGLVPLYQHLKQDQEAALVMTAKTRALIIADALHQTQELTTQISRTPITPALQNYYQGKLQLQPLKRMTQSYLEKFLNESIVGISRFDTQGNLLVQTGLPIPQQFLHSLTVEEKIPLIRGIISSGKNTYLVMSAAIVEKQPIGTDIILLHLSNWEQMTSSSPDFTQSTRSILGMIQNEQVLLLLPSSHSMEGAAATPFPDSQIGQILEAIKRQNSQNSLNITSFNHQIVTYSPVAASDWNLFIKIDATEFYSPVYQKILTVGGAYLILILISLSVIAVFLGPISRKIQTEIQQSAKETQLLQDITQAVTAAADFEAALAIALKMLCQETGWEYGEAWIPNDEGSCLECSPILYNKNPQLESYRKATEMMTFPPNEGLPGRVWSSRQPLWIQDVSIQPQAIFVRNRIAQSVGLKSGFGVPIMANHQVLAVLVFFMFQAKAENQRLVELISLVALQLGSVFQCKYAEAKYRSIFENSVEGIFQTAPDGHYISANPTLAMIYGYNSPWELMTKLANVESQLYVEPSRRYQFIQLLQETDIVRNFESQVYRQDGSVIWISENARAVRDNRGKLLYYEGTVVDITDRKWTEEQLRYNASHDALTGLWNRAWFMEQLVKAVSLSNEQIDYGFALLFLDLDDFKLINDSLGHWIGDQLLISISGKLQNCLRPGDVLARLGGDEFTILLEDIQDLSEVLEIAHRVQDVLNSSFKLGVHEIFTAASIGMVLHSQGKFGHPPLHQPQDLLRDADTALYRAKSQGKGCYVVFDQAMRDETVKRLQLETDLRWAIQRQEFQVYYQPIILLATGEISGFEALIRWQHPQQGFISPKDFIPIAEEAGLIVPIGEWVLREACRQLRCWKKQFPRYSLLRMNVNLSSQQLTPELSQQVEQILYETGIDGWELKLEITETMIMADPKGATVTLNQLKSQDIQLCLDDFGTGYCSLSYLHQFPVDTLKIDQSFIDQMLVQNEKLEIVKTIIALAHSLGMDVVAEGVEDMKQLHQLRLLQCKYGQGYLFSKPLNYEAASVLLMQQPIRVSLLD